MMDIENYMIWHDILTLTKYECCCSFVRLIAPVVTTTSIIVSFNEIG